MLADRAGRARPLLAVVLALTACHPIAPPPYPREVVRTGTTSTPFITDTPQGMP